MPRSTGLTIQGKEMVRAGKPGTGKDYSIEEIRAAIPGASERMVKGWIRDRDKSLGVTTTQRVALADEMIVFGKPDTGNEYTTTEIREKTKLVRSTVINHRKAYKNTLRLWRPTEDQTGFTNGATTVPVKDLIEAGDAGWDIRGRTSEGLEDFLLVAIYAKPAQIEASWQTYTNAKTGRDKAISRRE